MVPFFRYILNCLMLWLSFYVCIYLASQDICSFLLTITFIEASDLVLKKKKLHLHNAVQFQSHISLASLRSVLIPLKIPSVNVLCSSNPMKNSKKSIGKAKYKTQSHNVSMEKLRHILINLPGLSM